MMKKILAIVLTVFMALQMIPFSVLAEERNMDGEQKEITVVESSSDTEDGTIPSKAVKAASPVPVDEEHFPDDAFRAYVQTYCDGNGDGELDDVEIPEVTSIDVSEQQIASLRGLEYFTELRGLFCHGNQLVELDVSGNTMLTNLSCSDNQLTELDLSETTMLVALWCSRNQLTELDVSGCGELEYLDCDRNQLTELDVTGWSLEHLYCSNNQLTALDLSTCKNLIDFSCHDNQLTELDVSSNTMLTNLSCSDNQLTKLDVTGCTELQDLSCSENQLTKLDVSGCAVLTRLSCCMDQLTELNVNGCTMLQSLMCFENQLTELDVSGSVNLETLNCYGNNLKELDVSKNINLESLDCSVNDLTELNLKGALALTELVSWGNLLTDLDVSGNPALVEMNCASNQLTKLDVSGNAAIEQLICSRNQLTELNLAGTSRLYYLICNRNNMSVLDISGSEILLQIVSGGQKSEENGFVDYTGPAEDYYLYVDAGTELLTSPPAPSGVPVDEEHFPDANFRACVASLFDTDNSGYLEETEIESAVGFYESGREIADLQGIEYLSNLQYLTCSSNRLEKLDLSKNKALIQLDCLDNQITELNISGNAALEKIVCSSNKLENLDLSGNPVLSSIDCRNNLLKELDVSKNPALTYLCCDQNQIDVLDVSGCETLVMIVTQGTYSSYDGWKQYFLWGTGSVLTDLSTRILPIDSGIEINETNFPDDTFRSIISRDFDSDHNDLLSDEEIAAATIMYVSYDDIASLQGIEYFTALQQLDCRDNQLTSLDLSHNTSLTWLRCENNCLTSLVLGENSALTQLICDSNQLTELDVSGAPLLETLSCCDNRIAELDIRNCPNLIAAYNAGGSESMYNGSIPVYVWMTEDYALAVDKATSVKVSDVEIVPAFKSQSLVLSGQIGLNFFLELPEIPGVDYTQSYMTFTIGKSATEYRDDFDPGHMNSAGTRYGFTCYVNSIQMADTIKAVFHYGTNRTVTKEYSVAQYIDFFEKNINSFNAKTIALIHAIADFGHYEQIYLADVNHWTIGESYAEMEKYYTETYDYSTILSAVNSKAFVKTLGNSDVEKATYKLHLDSETTVDVFLTPKSGKTLTASATFNGETYTAVKQSDGRYLVQIPNISAHQLGDMITITGTAGTAFSVQVSALSYTRSVLNSTSTNKAAKDGLSALYAYYTAVLAYRK